MRIAKPAAAWFGLILLAACQPEEPENIQTKAENVSKMLENRAEEIAAEADNGTDRMVDALENEAALLAN